VVDDEEVSRYVMRQHLATPRHVVLEAASGAEGLRLAAMEKPDVICLDLMMPDTDGHSVLRRLKGDPETRDIPVLIVTSKRLEDDERSRLLELANGVLGKEAVSRERVLAAVEDAIRTRERAA
jgi:CheY-like chemotaxis protein